MAAFASCRRSGWVRLLVVILCAFFIFATLGAPPVQALGVESVALFGLASVLSAATAALGFKLVSNEQGQATLQKMVQDFKTVAWATGFVLVGSKLNGLQNGMDYIKMQVQNGKTYLDARVFAWVQQWLAENGVYNAGSVSLNNSAFNDCNTVGDVVGFSNFTKPLLSLQDVFTFYNLGNYDDTTGWAKDSFEKSWNQHPAIINYYIGNGINTKNVYHVYILYASTKLVNYNNELCFLLDRGSYSGAEYYDPLNKNFGTDYISYGLGYIPVSKCISNFASTLDVLGNSTGLSGTDTLGEDYVNKTLEQILAGLKEWAQDWFDAGADSATNAATGALDLPLTVATGAATANPSIAEDGPLVWFPPFSIPIPNLRTGETDTKTVDQGKENASAAETSTVDVAENQTVIDSLVNWALNYISPDTGLFSKFPLCVPYDAYLLVTSSLGVDAVGSDSIFGASPGDLEGVVSQDIETYSDFHPIINIKHDFELDGVMYPLDITIDLTPWQPLVYFFREGMALLLVAELIGSEFKRIRGH